MRGIEMKETDPRTSAFTKTSWKSKTDLNNHNYGTYLQELPLKYIFSNSMGRFYVL